MNGMTFDQIERYRGAGLVLQTVFDGANVSKPKVLDLGGYFKTLGGKVLFPLGKLYPEFDCTVADVTDYNGGNYIVLDPCNPVLPFKDNEFDAVICMDVLEHIVPDRRRVFVSETLRICRKILIMAAPFYEPYRVIADQWLSDFCSELFDEKNRMLEEHLENGLPEAHKFESLLNNAGYPFISFPNGDLRAWYQTMAIKHLLLFGQGPVAAENFDFEAGSLADPIVDDGLSYRDIYVVDTANVAGAGVSNLSLSLDSMKKALASTKRIMKNTRKKQPDRSMEAICSKHLLLIGDSIKGFTDLVTTQKHQIDLLNETVATDIRSKKLLQMKLDHLDMVNRKVLRDIREKDIHIQHLTMQSKEREKTILGHIDEYECGLKELRSSAAFRTGKLVLAPIKVAAKLVKRILNSEGQVINKPTIVDQESQIKNNNFREGQVTKHKTITQDSRLLTLTHQTVFSLLVPVYNTEEAVLKAMIDSVIAQTYPHWQLCMVDDASTNDTPRKVIKEYATAYPEKIIFEFAKENGGIAVATRKASQLARGEFICLLDHDDLLAEDALMEVARQVEITPHVDYIYSDEDKVNQDGTRFSQAYHKPDFDPELLLCNNYLNHFSVIRKSLFDTIGGYREGYDGSQDYDLYLRVTEKARQIAHIPRILYHWRMVPNSTAVDPAAKGGLFRESSFKVLESAIERRGLDAVVEKGLSPGTYRVRYAVSSGRKVSIIIPTRDAGELVEQCVTTIRTHTIYPDYEIVVVDNGTTDAATLEYLQRQVKSSKTFRVVKYDHRFNFSEINNYAVQQTDSPFLVFMNNDIAITDDGWLTSMLEHGQKEAVGAVGAKLLYPDGRIQHAGVFLGQGGVAGHPFKGMPEYNGVYFGHSNLVKNYSAVTAACLLTRRSVFDEIGGFNPELAVSFGDIDLCMEIRKLGYRIVYTPYARMIHHESVSRLDDNDAPRRPRFHSEITYMISKWGDALYNDPYLNPNLSILRYDMSLRAPEENETLNAYRRAFRGFNPNNE